MVGVGHGVLFARWNDKCIASARERCVVAKGHGLILRSQGRRGDLRRTAAIGIKLER